MAAYPYLLGDKLHVEKPSSPLHFRYTQLLTFADRDVVQREVGWEGNTHFHGLVVDAVDGRNLPNGSGDFDGQPFVYQLFGYVSIFQPRKLPGDDDGGEPFASVRRQGFG